MEAYDTRVVTMAGASFGVPAIKSTPRKEWIDFRMKNIYVWPDKDKKTKRAMLGQVYDIGKSM